MPYHKLLSLIAIVMAGFGAYLIISAKPRRRS